MIIINVACAPKHLGKSNALEAEARELVPLAVKAIAEQPSLSTPNRVFSFIGDPSTKEMPGHDVLIIANIYTGKDTQWQHRLPLQSLAKELEEAFKRLHEGLNIRILLTSGGKRGALRVGPLELNTKLNTGYLVQFKKKVESLAAKPAKAS